MKKILAAAVLFGLISCNETQGQKDYAKISGKITNPVEGQAFRLFNPATNKTRLLEVDKDGNFNDTLHLKKSTSFSATYTGYFGVELANGMDLKLNFDSKNIGKTITFSGDGSVANNYMREKSKSLGKLIGEDYKGFFGTEKAQFDNAVDEHIAKVSSLLNDNANELGTAFVAREKVAFADFKKDMQVQNDKQLKIDKNLKPGMMSPQFSNYEDYKGGKKSLTDFKGKYVFIDLWATWCGPCKYEVPFLIDLEKKYHGKNIEFVSISIDRQKDKEKWKKMIAKEGMTGTHLLADNEIDSDFVKAYYVEAIPQFILLDPQGKIVSNNTARPSEPELIELFDSLGI